MTKTTKIHLNRTISTILYISLGTVTIKACLRSIKIWLGRILVLLWILVVICLWFLLFQDFDFDIKYIFSEFSYLTIFLTKKDTATHKIPHQRPQTFHKQPIINMSSRPRATANGTGGGRYVTVHNEFRNDYAKKKHLSENLRKKISDKV